MVLRRSIAKASTFALLIAAIAAPEDGAEADTSATRETRETREGVDPPSASASLGGEPARPSIDTTCGEGMILVDGESCPDAEHVCLRWLDPPPYQNLRCAEYAKPAKCKGARVKLRFCVDRDEYADKGVTSPTGSLFPMVGKNWREAQALCGARNARLCKESEWQFACEGPDMNPYPYGFKRDSSVCNFDKTELGGAEAKLKDLRAPLDAFPLCTSPFGVHDMVGNVDEWVEREGATAPNRSALRGGWWLPGRNRCRAATIHHGEEYSGKQVGFRCCKDAAAP